MQPQPRVEGVSLSGAQWLVKQESYITGGKPGVTSHDTGDDHQRSNFTSYLTVSKKGVDRQAKPGKLGFHQETENQELPNADQQTQSYLDATDL